MCATASAAHAFCGFYVSGSGEKMFNDATQVVLMREGTRTVLSMQNDYKGPLEDFAMVVPVPVVLHERDVKTLAEGRCSTTSTRSGSPRLVEYWEQDPCPAPERARTYDKAPRCGGGRRWPGGDGAGMAPTGVGARSRRSSTSASTRS